MNTEKAPGGYPGASPINTRQQPRGAAPSVAEPGDIRGHVATAARRGWPVFPLLPGEKRPVRDCVRCRESAGDCLTDDTCPCWQAGRWCHGFKAATAELTRLRPHWPADATGYGIHTGAASLVVVDLDRKGAPDGPQLAEAAGFGDIRAEDGVALFRRVWESTGVNWAETYTVATPSGGVHLYYRAPEQPVSPTVGRRANGRVVGLGCGIDVRAGGAYVVGAGSWVQVRDASGQATHWQAYDVVRDVEPAPLPGWLSGWLDRTGHMPPERPERPLRQAVLPVPSSRAERAVQAALRDEAERLSRAVQGERRDTCNSAAYRLGGYVASGYIAEDVVVETLLAAAPINEHGDRRTGERFSRAEAEKNITRGLTAGMRRPRTIGDTAA